MNESWKTSKELVAEFKMSEISFRQMVFRKQIRLKKEIQNGKKITLYSWNDLVARKGTAGKGASVTTNVTKDVTESSVGLSQNNPTETLPNNYESIADRLGLFGIEKQRFISALSMTKFNAESVLKSEQALAKMRENLVDEKHLIDIRTLQHDLENLFSTTWTQLKEQIDAWQLRYNFPAKQAKEMFGDYSKLLEKIRAKAKALGNAPSAP